MLSMFGALRRAQVFYCPVHSNGEGIEMGTVKNQIAFKAALFCCAWAVSGAASAATYVCTNDSCSAWAAISASQLAQQSNDTEKTTVQAAISNSTQESVTNGYNSVAGTDIYLKAGLWHKGGDDPFKGFDHVTAYVWKNGSRVKSCHVFSYRQAGKTAYFATCAASTSKEHRKHS